MKRDLDGFIYGCGLALFFAFSCFGQNHGLTVAETKPEVQTLEFGQKVERDIVGGERHLYKIKLGENQFVKIEAEQTNCDIVLSMQSPEKINVFEFKDDNHRNGSEVQTAAVAVTGEYELRIVSFEDPSQKGKYTLRIAELRPATEKELSQTSAFEMGNRHFKTDLGTLTTEQIRERIELYKTILDKFRFAENRHWEAITLSSIGSQYSFLGNWSKAAELQKQALEIQRSIGENKEIIFLLANLGTTYIQNNEPQKALETLFEAADLAAKNKDVFIQSRIFNSIGYVYEETGDAARALTYYAQALETAQNTSQDKDAAVALNDLGRVSFTLGDSQKAIEYFQKSIELARRIKNKRLEAAVLSSLGQIFFALGNETKAAENLTEGLNLIRSVGDKLGEATTLQKIGKMRLALGKPDEAIEFFKQAQELYRTVGSLRNVADNLLLTAKAEAKKGNLEAAQAGTEEAVALIEKVRERMRTADLRDPFSTNLRDYYGFYIEVLMARHKLEPNKNFAALALQANERGRARGLLNLLAESNADLRQGADAKLLEKENEIKNLLSARLQNLTKVLNGKTDAKKTADLKNEIEQIRLEYEQIQNQIRTTSPRYAALTQPKTLSLAEIQTEILDADTVLMEYALGETKSFLWLVAKNDFRVFELPAKSEIETAARQFYESLTARNKQVKFETPAERGDRIFLADSDAQKFARELGEKILAPAAPLLANKRLLIVADGALQYVPFAALKVSSTKSQVASSKLNIDSRLKTQDSGLFLVETNEIVNLPSASALSVLRKETNGRTLAPKTLAVLADPVFNKTDERFLTIGSKNKPKEEFIAVSNRQTRGIDFPLTRDGWDLSRLPFTRREANSISALVPDNQKAKLLDFSATRQAAMSPELANYRFVHFATHGFINNENPELSGIIFSMIDENGKDRDGFLRVGDVYNLRLPAEMIVLSGCRTGLGKEIKGEGLIGLTRGFMYAGARRVAVSLWDVNDEATSELMSQFYREMLGAKKLSPAAALRQAQVSMIRNKEWNNPFYWATFTLQGEPK